MLVLGAVLAPFVGRGSASIVRAAALPTIPCSPSVLKVFSGYNADVAPVREVSATWVVPKIATHSGGSQAATWIGMKAAAHGQTESFVQEGTLERVHTTGNPAAHGYEAFWSSTLHHDSEQKLFSVSPGNTIVTNLVRSASGVAVTISDVDTGTHAHVVAPVSATVVFTRASWLQEDPSTGCSEGVYPRTSPVTFQDVEVNGAAPTLSDQDATIMFTPNNVILVPTHFSNDAFTVRSPTGIEKRYLKDVAREVVLWIPFLSEAQHASTKGTKLTGPTDRSLALTTAHQLEASLDGLRRNLLRQHWPAGVRHLVTRLARQSARVVKLLGAEAREAARGRVWGLTELLPPIHKELVLSTRIGLKFGV